MNAVNFKDIITINDSFHEAALLHHAVKVRLFDFLTQPRPARSVAAEFGWQPGKTVLLLNALSALGFLSKTTDAFQCTPGTEVLLTSGSDKTLSPVIENQRIQWQMWGNIGEFLESEGPHPQHQKVRLAHDAAANRNYNAAMRNLSVGNITTFLGLGIVRDGDVVLDLAGGHGIYLAEILKSFPKASGAVWELPAAANFARAMLDDEAVLGRASVVEQDISKPGVLQEERADLILLNNCLHYFSAETSARLVKDAIQALQPGGRIVITAVDLDAEGTSPVPAALFAFNMMMNADEGGLHTTEALKGFLQAAGLDVRSAPGGSLGVMNVNVLWGEKS